jgi:benzoyl-CoA reductase/2-hydroxyglutaryl-CoA dehydratase subunit BcrC/BadD/HgdB
VRIIRDAMRKSFADPEFAAEFNKLMGDPPAPLSGEELEQAINELPRDKEVVELYKQMAGGGPLPAR